jgi:hypothetical protein
MIAESSPFFPWFSTVRRRTRRIVVAAYWAVTLGLFGVYQWALVYRAGHFGGQDLLFPLYIVVFLPAFLGGVRAGGMVKPFNGVRWVPLPDRDQTQTLFGPSRPLLGSMTASDLELDERERQDRNRVHFVAYTMARWLALGLLVVQCGASLAGTEWLLRIGNAAFFLLALILWSLPQTLILWTEPDLEAQQ